jgi:hypothetical protein
MCVGRFEEQEGEEDEEEEEGPEGSMLVDWEEDEEGLPEGAPGRAPEAPSRWLSILDVACADGVTSRIAPEAHMLAIEGSWSALEG